MQSLFKSETIIDSEIKVVILNEGSMHIAHFRHA